MNQAQCTLVLKHTEVGLLGPLALVEMLLEMSYSLESYSVELTREKAVSNVLNTWSSFV